MTTYIITYDLHQPGQEYHPLIDALKKSYPAHGRLQLSVWLIVTDESAQQIRDRLAQYIDKNDKIFVAKVSRPAAWKGYDQGWSDWLKRHL